MSRDYNYNSHAPKLQLLFWSLGSASDTVMVTIRRETIAACLSVYINFT